MTHQMLPKKYRLLVVAHPDDETIFFSGPILQLRDLPWVVVCATDGNGDGRGNRRKKELQQAWKLLGVSMGIQWDFADKYNCRLSQARLVEKLSLFSNAREIYTHGPLGEYGHPHHQDLSLAVHTQFGKKKKIFCPAWNSESTHTFQLSEKELKIKQKLFFTVYKSETIRFFNLIPCQVVESFTTYNRQEAIDIGMYLLRKKSLAQVQFEQHASVKAHLPEFRKRVESRLF